MTPTSQKSNPIIPTQQGSPLHISQVPNDPLTLSFVNTLEIRDLCFDISCYGPFLKDLPRRFGSSPALDAAGTALVASYPYFKNKDIPRHVLARFVKALKTLRECLSDPNEARSPNTLSAIYLISICQVITPGNVSSVYCADQDNNRAGLETMRGSEQVIRKPLCIY
ncbi:hypothetical protein N7493_004277 [Penicillium malachiteum]|uniref:Uncharacterized protein n=1 Tax=Penicillium malachiteum TaxID=1324776 RepID=A0AAD6HR79_9EURO|nr:hypothetical protein N7493_004277 [Penicillium malachiteum]